MDHLFKRDVIPGKQYRRFWEGYWNEETSRARARYIDRFVSDRQIKLPFSKRMESGTITFSRKAAQEQAEIIGGYVIRVTKTGKPSRRGKFFRAIAKRRKNNGNTATM